MFWETVATAVAIVLAVLALVATYEVGLIQGEGGGWDAGFREGVRVTRELDAAHTERAVAAAYHKGWAAAMDAQFGVPQGLRDLSE